MNLGAEDYLTKTPIAKTHLLDAVRARLTRQVQQSTPEFEPDFSSHVPLLSPGLTPCVAEVLLWAAQGKTNPDIATLPGKRASRGKAPHGHPGDTRHRNPPAATLQAWEVLVRRLQSRAVLERPNEAMNRSLKTVSKADSAGLSHQPRASFLQPENVPVVG